MDDHDPDGGLRVELWTRDLSPPPDGPRRAVVSRLRELEHREVVDEVAVRVWGKYVALPDAADTVDDPVRRRLAELQAWAERNDHSLEPAFETVKRSTLVSDASERAVRLPLQCLATYEEGRLVGVVPCSTEAGTNTVADCLERLERGATGRVSEPE